MDFNLEKGFSMSKTVNCPVKEFSGYVIFHDPMTITQAASYETAKFYAEQFSKRGTDSALYATAIVPGALVCVEKWSLKGIQEGITLDSIPLKPHKARAEFVAWLVAEVEKLYADTEVPNE
jgi:hypothetical protein